MSDVEQATVDAPETSAVGVAPALPRPWLKPRLETWRLADQTQGAHGHGSDSHSCLS